MALDDSTAELAEMATRTRELAGTFGGPADIPVRMAAEAFDEALLRLGVPFAGERDDSEQYPLVLRVEVRVGTDR